MKAYPSALFFRLSLARFDQRGGFRVVRLELGHVRQRHEPRKYQCDERKGDAREEDQEKSLATP